MTYVIKDLIGQMTDTLKADTLFNGVTVARHTGEVNAFLFNDPKYWEGLVKKIPFVLVRYLGREAYKKDSTGAQVWWHRLTFGAYIGAKSLKSKDDATEEAEEYMAKIFDLWHGRVFKSSQTWASNVPVLSGATISTTGFKQQQPLYEDGGMDERLIFTLPEITLYEIKYNVVLLAYT